jgi:TolA-binding protein
MRPCAARVFFAAASLLVFLVPACSDPARERFERAEKAFLEQEMDAALTRYRSIPIDFPQSRYAPAALLRQGDLFGSYYRRDEAAVEAYGSLLFNYPRSPEAPRAVLRRAEIRLLKFFDYAAAVADLELIRKQYPGFPGMDDVMLLLGKAYGGLPDRARQAKVLSELIEEYPDSPRAMEARWTKAFLLLAEGGRAGAMGDGAGDGRGGRHRGGDHAVRGDPGRLGGPRLRCAESEAPQEKAKNEINFPARATLRGEQGIWQRNKKSESGS